MTKCGEGRWFSLKLMAPIGGMCCLLVALMAGCGSERSGEKTQETAARSVQSPVFNADSAYAFIAKQVDFGPRVPNTRAHVQCGDYLVAKLRSYDWQVTEQPFQAVTYDGVRLNARNLIGSYNPAAKKRILLAAHWDSRPFADEDPEHAAQPVPAANDGASGVGVLLELARVIRADSGKLNLGVDIIFFDAEDWGNSKVATDEYGGFCLGSQYWAGNRHVQNYAAYYGILLDMVGAKNATFPKEGLSMTYAGDVVNKVWDTAARLGYNNYFINKLGSSVGIDDHVPVNKIARIPMIDIIHLNPESHGFFEHWHTVNDTMEHIDPKTLKAVGQTVLQVLYEEGMPVL